MTTVLEGLRVIELCEVFQGPLAGQILGDYGADVLKIERPGRGDSLRHSDTVANARNEMGSYFAAVNRNKRSLALDLKLEDDRAFFLSLVAEADVLMHNYRPGVLDKLGFSYERLKQINRRLIYAEASGFGSSGPLSSMAGQDFLIQAISGLAWKTTKSKESPTFINVPIADYTSGVMLAQGILLALLERERSGQGQQVGVSLFSTLVAMQSLEAATELNYNYETHWFERALNFTVQASNGWLIVIGFFRDNPLSLISRALGLQDLSSTPAWSTKHDQARHKEEIANVLRPHFKNITVDQAVSQLQTEGVLAAPIYRFNEVLQHPQTQQNELIASVPVSGENPKHVLVHPIKLSRTPATIRRGPPKLNEHDHQVWE